MTTLTPTEGTLSNSTRIAAGQTKAWKHILASREHHDRIAMLAIQNDSTLSKEAAKAFSFYFAHLDRIAASSKSKRA